MSYEWNWAVFLQSPNGADTYLDWLWQGFLTTVEISLMAWVLAFVLGSLLGIMRTTSSRLMRGVAMAYVDVMRNVPLIVQLFMWYFLMPNFLPAGVRNWLFALPPQDSALLTAAVGLGAYTASRICEQVRAGIESLPQGLRNAGLAMGMTQPQVYRHVLLPLAYRILLPPLTSESLSLVKNSSIAGTVGVYELFARVNQLNDYTNKPYESFLTVAACYLLINASIMFVMTRVERRMRLPGTLGAK
ncbi:glutamate/aspartate transport system permease [Bordetella ansorpii]|uniref:Glutamate/aspartate transport system permease n=1 Tax=Bordetella ansorpii TaxID=288768 RepID=A0A157QAA1_9BORD|nr:amino acid ABC transporter permease [Bordetella ansorpii]SAI42865.1 glutamate/aspartate transport system permease [Bordetella ansorpii]